MFDDASPIGYVSFDEQAHVTQMNAAAAKLLGVQRKMFLGLPFPAALHADEVPKFLEHLYRCRAGVETYISTELKLGKRDHTRIPVELASAPTSTEGQRRFPTAIIDLRRSERRLQTLLAAKQLAEHVFEFVSYPLAVLNEHLIIEATNSAFREKFRVRAEELQGRSLFELEMIGWDNAEFMRSLQRVVTHRETMKELTVECSLRVSGGPLTLLANAIRLIPSPLARPLVLLTFEDITHRRHHEEERETMLAELQKMNATLEQRVRERTAELDKANERLRALSQRVIQAQESERRYLARELHDEVGQTLTGLNMLLHRASDEANGPARAEIRGARKVVADLLQQVRQISLDLRPAVLDDLGLCVAVQSHITTFSKRTGVRVEFHCENVSEPRISPEVKITVFRCVQEALTNVARHAAVRAASVSLHTNHEQLFVDIEDKGRGFDAAGLRPASCTGLSGMHERVALAGGELLIESAPGIGTHISSRLPLQRAKEGK
jgi:PAS domain S-box-containing protein